MLPPVFRSAVCRSAMTMYSRPWAYQATYAAPWNTTITCYTPCKHLRPTTMNAFPWHSQPLHTYSSMLFPLWKQQHWAATSSRPFVHGPTMHIRHNHHKTPHASAEQDATTDSPHPLAALPTQLTVCRVIAIPALVAVWYMGSTWAAPASCALFVAAALTDWADGFLARKLKATSAFGAFLDPVADKLMVATVLVLLSSQPIAAGTLVGNTWLIPVSTIAIISREIAMSAIREWTATLGEAARSAAAVNWIGKWKTATQMVALSLLLYTSSGGGGQWIPLVSDIGCGLLAVATGLTLVSLVQYMRAVARFFK